MTDFGVAYSNTQAGSPVPVYFRSERTDWETPQWLFALLDTEFRFTLDGAANTQNAKCPRFLGPGSLIAEDGLSYNWAGEVVWLNPPYGRDLSLWLRKAVISRDAGATVVCLLPARTDTVWFHEAVLAKAQEIRFLRGRLKFSASRFCAPFPSLLVVFRPGITTSFSNVSPRTPHTTEVFRAIRCRPLLPPGERAFRAPEHATRAHYVYP